MPALTFFTIFFNYGQTTVQFLSVAKISEGPQQALTLWIPTGNLWVYLVNCGGVHTNNRASITQHLLAPLKGSQDTPGCCGTQLRITSIGNEDGAWPVGP